MMRRPRSSTLFPYTTLFRSQLKANYAAAGVQGELVAFIDDMARRYADADLVVCRAGAVTIAELSAGGMRSEEHTSELQSQFHLVCRLLLEKKKQDHPVIIAP